ncbi:Beta-galactosidase C-terminal domain, partial [Agromyces humi]|uniref:Beta-galactosidase C-terminal domain n=1 Tax=Agromyces humi TaxID=1766800 RepID=UPI00193AB51E
TLPDPEALARLASRLVEEAGVEVPAPVANGDTVEVVRRGGLVFAINHGADDVDLVVEGTDLLTGSRAAGLVLPSQGVAVVRPD